MDTNTFRYSLRCYLSKEVYQERIEELLSLPKAHQSAFLEMIIFGFSIEEAKDACEKLADLSRKYGVSAVSILHSIKRIDHGIKLDCLLKELTAAELN